MLPVEVVRRNEHGHEGFCVRSAHRAKGYAKVALNALGVSQLCVLNRHRPALTDPELTLPVH